MKRRSERINASRSSHPCELFEMRQTDRERLATTHGSIAMLRLTSLFGKCIPKTPPHVDEPERTSNRLSRNQVPEQVCRFESGQSNADLQTPRQTKQVYSMKKYLSRNIAALVTALFVLVLLP